MTEQKIKTTYDHDLNLKIEEVRGFDDNTQDADDAERIKIPQPLTMLDLMNHMESFVRNTFIGGKDDSLYPMWTIFCNDGEIIPIQAIWQTTEEKRNTFEFVKKTVRERKAAIAGFMVETWVSVIPVDEKPVCAPSEDPNRKEMVLLTVADRFGRKMVRTINIERDADGIPKLAETNETEGADFCGPMVDDIFDKEDTLN